MAKVRTTYVCSECGGTAPRWSGRCPHCEAWNALAEEVVSRPPRGRGRPERVGPAASPVPLAGVPAEATARWASGLGEFDFVLGGGVVPGSLVLVGGEPGIGKSTLLLQLAARFVESGRSVLYVSGEESAAQVRIRGERLGPAALRVPFLTETELEAILARVEAEPVDLLVVDSVQTVALPSVDSPAGSVLQVRQVAAAIGERAKSRGTAAFVVGHVTKEGGLAGPKTLEHLVDVVLYFEGTGSSEHRVVHATKNRFGRVDEIAVFRMTAAGRSSSPSSSAARGSTWGAATSS